MSKPTHVAGTPSSDASGELEAVLFLLETGSHGEGLSKAKEVRNTGMYVVPSSVNAWSDVRNASGIPREVQ